MNHLIVFMLVNTMYFRLNEACKLNIIEIHNQLGPGRRLQHHCRRNIDQLDRKIHYLKFNETEVIRFQNIYIQDVIGQYGLVLLGMDQI